MKGLHGLVVLASALSLLGAVGPAPAQETRAAYPNTVIEVGVEGNKFLSDSAVLANVKTRPGNPYNEEVVRADEQRLLKTRRFDNVVVEKTQTDKGIIVTFKVTERPRVQMLQFEGNKSIKESQLRKLVTFGTGDPADMFQIAAGARAIESHYRSEGYRYVKVTTDRSALTRQRRVIYRIVEGPKAHIRKVHFEGNRSFGGRRLNGVVKSRSRLWPIRAGVLDIETVERDVIDLQNFYRGEGFLDVDVAWKAADSPDKRKVDLTFVIDEGPRYRIRKTLFEGATVFAGEELRRSLNLVRGEFYDGETLRRDTKKLHDLYGEIGYIDVQVTVQTRYVAPNQPVPDWYRPAPGERPAFVDLVYTVVEFQQFRVGRIDVRGNTVTKMKVIRRELRLSPGQFYNTVAVAESRRRLEETGLFSEVTITPYGDDPNVRHAVVQIKEANTAQFLIGAGISSNAGLLGNVSLTERNFDISNWHGRRGGRLFRGGGQVFSISAEPGTEFMRFVVSWREPYLMGKPYSLGTKAFMFTSDRETWDETRYGAVVSLGKRFKNRWYGEIAGRVEGVEVASLSSTAPPDVVSDRGTSLLTGIKGTIVRDRTDSRWLPSKGDRVSFSYEQVVGDYNFGRANADYRRYCTVHMDSLDRKHILAGRVAGGGIIGDAPVFERFYGGGLGSIRGFQYRGVSPRQGAAKEVVGGEFMVFVGGEYTFPLVGKNLRGVVFLDTGTVEDSFGVSDYRASAGVGIRIHMPFFGPLRPVPLTLDFGFPLKKASGDDTELVSFSFGWVF